MLHTACLVLNVSSVCGHHKILAVKAGTSIHPTCLPFRTACLVHARYLRSCFVEVNFYWTKMLEQSTSHRYLWPSNKILAVTAGTLIYPTCLPFRPACLVCACYSRSCIVEVNFLWTKMLEQSTSLWYLWPSHKILAVKAGTSIHPNCLPFRPACIVCARYLLSCFVEVEF